MFPVIPDIMKITSSQYLGVGAIAYRPYVMEILKELQPQGWPVFGGLLMVLYAMQDGYTDFAGPLGRTANFYNGENLDFDIEGAVEFLEKIKSLPKVYKQGQNRIVLLQTIFSHGQNSSASCRISFEQVL
jgi:hypothetical protein